MSPPITTTLKQQGAAMLSLDGQTILITGASRGIGAATVAFLIAPGWVQTDMASIIYEPGFEAALAEIPMGEAAPPEQVGNMAVFLLSGMVDHATGATFDINGASYVR